MDLNDNLSIDKIELTSVQKRAFTCENKNIEFLVKKIVYDFNKNTSNNYINLIDIIKGVGLNAEYANIDTYTSLDLDNKTILINKDNVSMKDKLFNIAIEIGHYVLLQNYKETNELNATLFAIELLMPYNQFRNKMIFGYSIDNLSDYFNISYEVAYYRYNYIVKKLD